MKRFFTLRRFAGFAVLAAAALMSTSCYHDYHGYYYHYPGHGIGLAASVHYYEYRGHRYRYGTGPWFRNGIYHGPTRHYVVGGHRYLHGHGPWYRGGRYVVVHRKPAVVHRSIRGFRSPGRVLRTPGRVGPVRRLPSVRLPGRLEAGRRHFSGMGGRGASRHSTRRR